MLKSKPLHTWNQCYLQYSELFRSHVNESACFFAPAYEPDRYVDLTKSFKDWEKNISTEVSLVHNNISGVWNIGCFCVYNN